jgi:Tol biopolymer transport system component
MQRKKWVLGLIGLVIIGGMLVCCGLWYRPDPQPPLMAASDLALQGRIAFASYDFLPHQGIFIINADGSEKKQLTTGGTFPSWSPDGTRLAFERDGEIHLIHADGTNLTQLTNDSLDYVAPFWSPDGTRLVSTVHMLNKPFKDRTIHIILADGTGTIRLTSPPGTNGSPMWSPDGTQIAFNAYLNDHADIYLVNADGTNPINLTNHPASDTRPTWSPTGTHLTFLSDRHGKDEPCLMKSDGSELTCPFPFEEVETVPVWSPDGIMLAFEYDHGGFVQPAEPDHDLFVVQVGETTPTRLSHESVQVTGSPVWSPDSAAVAFKCQSSELVDGYYQWGICVARSDGSGMAWLVEHGSLPAWQP